MLNKIVITMSIFGTSEVPGPPPWDTPRHDPKRYRERRASTLRSPGGPWEREQVG